MGLRSAIELLVHACLPQSCILCDEPVAAEPVCASCKATLPDLPLARCPRCLITTIGSMPCGHCLHTPPAFDSAIACFAYAFPVDRLIQALKYQHQLYLASWFGRRLFEKVRREAVLPNYICPLPLTRAHQKERGFNQATEIARYLSRQLKIPLSYDLLRIKEGPAQTRLSGSQRRQNVRNAYAVSKHSKEPWTGAKVAIVDDVLTTGASVSEAARALKQVGAAEVVAWVVARTYPDLTDHQYRTPSMRIPRDAQPQITSAKQVAKEV